MKLSLVVLTPGKSEGRAIPIALSQFLIGRDPQCQLRPASPLISKRHCALLVRGGKVFVRDFDSTNGTFVNDQPVKGEVELHDQDQLKVGPLAFQVQLEASPSVSKPTPIPQHPSAESPDDMAAAMLLALQDDDPTPSGGSGLNVDSEGIPTGSTVMDMMSPHLQQQGDEQAEGKAGSKKPPVKGADGNTSSAAKAILDKYMRRPRG
jgi:pSer/pThr/pTyr-binding forkhead associated (FHA) protein